MIARATPVIVVIALAGLGFALPDAILIGSIAWLVVLFAVFSGWGHLAARVARIDDLDLGLRTVLGVAIVLAFAGAPLAVGVCNRAFLLAVTAIGIGGMAWREWTVLEPSWHGVHRALGFVRAHPVVGGVALAIGALVVYKVVGEMIALDRNAYDDDLAYTPFVRRLLDTGNLVEPFSFRRLGAYGGQTVLQALGAVRGSLATLHLVDRGFGQLLAMVLVVGYARERRIAWSVLGLLVVAIALAPTAVINSASYWTGAALFVGLYRLVGRERWFAAALVGAALCTLRQNYIPVVAVFMIITLVRQRSWRTAFVVVAMGILVVTPYAIAAVLSSKSFLFPFTTGTFNTAIDLGPPVTTWTDELGSLLWCSVDPTPFTVIPLLFVALVFTTDRRSLRPLVALFIASSIGFVLLVHSFLAAGPYDVWRYAFGFVFALFAIAAIELAGFSDDDDVRTSDIGRWLVIAAVVVQLVSIRSTLSNTFATLADNFVARAPSSEPARYAAMQRAIPAGASVVVMLDEPGHLDFARNAIANLDVPGYASPGDQLPMFQGSTAWHAYLKARGYEFAAFVRGSSSHAPFDRDKWFERMLVDEEFFATMAANTIDASDSLTQLATVLPVLYDAGGLVVIDLRGAPAPVAPSKIDERGRRAAFVQQLVDRAKLHDAWTLMTRDTVRFEDGITKKTFDASVEMGIRRRVHVRVRGSGVMHLEVRGRLGKGFAPMPLDVVVDHRVVATASVDAAGQFAVDTRIEATERWRDLYLVFASSSDPGKDVHDLEVARLTRFAWEP